MFPSLLRALFLGVSWTWVIGMFLPVLLVREYGVWAWVIFAAPNVVGAAAMGWLLATPGQSLAMTRAHAVACRAFSLVTVSFHVFFLCWLIVPWMSVRGVVPGVVLAVFAFLMLRRGAGVGVVLAAGVTYLFSLACAALILNDDGVGIVRHQPTENVAAALAALVPVCAFGFALNPYLDLTFHTARQASPTPASARVAFGVGFAVIFFTMIVFTLGYSGLLWREIMRGSVEGGAPPLGQSLVWFVLSHVLFQACFTSGIHVAEAVNAPRPGKAWGAVIIAAVVGIVAASWANRAVLVPRGDMLAGEFIYRLYMAFYALVFPAYAWICMTPTWRAPGPPTRRMLTVFAAAVAVAAPFFAVAFFGGRMIWVLPGLLIVVLARLAVRGRRVPEGQA